MTKTCIVKKHVRVRLKLGGVGSVAPLHYCTLTNKAEFAIFVSMMCSLLPEDLHSLLSISSVKLVLCRVSAVKRLPV